MRLLVVERQVLPELLARFHAAHPGVEIRLCQGGSDRLFEKMRDSRVDLAFVLRAFQKGADGVILGGCWLGECHYVTDGNYSA